MAGGCLSADARRSDASRAGWAGAAAAHRHAPHRACWRSRARGGLPGGQLRDVCLLLCLWCRRGGVADDRPTAWRRGSGWRLPDGGGGGVACADDRGRDRRFAHGRRAAAGVSRAAPRRRPRRLGLPPPHRLVDAWGDSRRRAWAGGRSGRPPLAGVRIHVLGGRSQCPPRVVSRLRPCGIPRARPARGRLGDVRGPLGACGGVGCVDALRSPRGGPKAWRPGPAATGSLGHRGHRPPLPAGTAAGGAGCSRGGRVRCRGADARLGRDDGPGGESGDGGNRVAGLDGACLAVDGDRCSCGAGRRCRRHGIRPADRHRRDAPRHRPDGGVCGVLRG